MRSKRLAASIVALGAVAVLGYGLVDVLVLRPEAEVGPAQPIPFSHRVHAAVKEIDCRFCHNTVDRSPQAGLPSMDKCLFCHREILAKHPVMGKLAASFDRGVAVSWVKVTTLPDHVFFQHDRHAVRGIGCEECHGKVEEMDRVREVRGLTMRFCRECHQAREASTDCWACHG